MFFGLLAEMTGLARDKVSLWWEGQDDDCARLDSASVVDIFTDQARLTHCGTVFLAKPDGQTSEETVVIIPKPQNDSRSKEKAESVMTIQTETVSQVELGMTGHLGVVCLNLNTGEDSKAGKKKTRMFFIMESLQANIFLTFFPLKKVKPFLTSQALSNSFLGKFDSKKILKVKESLYQDYIRSYIYFSTQFPQRYKLKEILLNSRNLPMLLNKMHFDEKLIQRALFDFIRFHKCQSKYCDGFSSTKCSGCKSVRYCDEKCQEIDFEKHSKVCQKIKKEKEKTLHVGLIIQKELQTRTSQPKLYSFEFFLSNVLAIVFEAFSGYLNEASLEVQIENDLHSYKIEKIDWENLRKLSNHKTTDRSRLKSQMLFEFGEENFLTKEDPDIRTMSKQLIGIMWSIISTLYKVLLISWFLTKCYKLSVGIPPFTSWW